MLLLPHQEHEVNSPTEDIKELLSRASQYDDKPHLLYSWVMVLAGKYLEGEKQEQVRLLMDREYNKPRTSEQAEAFANRSK